MNVAGHSKCRTLPSMSQRKRNRTSQLTIHANIFAALGDETRLALTRRLAGGGAQSISSLAGKTTLTRQAVSKHLRVLEEAGVVTSLKAGRETKFALRRDGISSARGYLDTVAQQWD